MGIPDWEVSIVIFSLLTPRVEFGTVIMVSQRSRFTHLRIHATKLKLLFSKVLLIRITNEREFTWAGIGERSD